MSSLPGERWREIDRIFAASLELPEAERPGFVARFTAHDPELGREVRALLDSGAVAESIIGESAASYAEPLLSALDPGRRKDLVELAAGAQLGPYRLLAEIGRGGMGAVYLAERTDAADEQRVAIKVVRRGWDTDDALRRFDHERKILASLDHPNIARLYGGGATDDGRPHLVMEYVAGRPITGYCDELRLSVDARLALLQTVCRAVEYAHRHRVVHRDLKPANILVTGGGEVKLLDFGIAKLLGDAAGPRTRTGARLLTPEYASPEQLLGLPVTAATDVYALGVLLYELITGERPHAPAGYTVREVLYAMLHRHVEPPSAVRARHGIVMARGAALDAITLKAMAKEPERRHQSADELMHDLSLQTEELPVTA